MFTHLPLLRCAIGNAHLDDLYDTVGSLLQPKVTAYVAVTDGHRILVTREGDGLYHLPGGVTESGEGALSALFRHFRSKVGFPFLGGEPRVLSHTLVVRSLPKCMNASFASVGESVSTEEEYIYLCKVSEEVMDAISTACIAECGAAVRKVDSFIPPEIGVSAVFWHAMKILKEDEIC